MSVIDPSTLTGPLKAAWLKSKEGELRRKGHLPAPKEPVALKPTAGTITLAKVIKSPLEEMNKTEQRCYHELVRSEQYKEVRPWAITLHLGHRCKYTPDFWCTGQLRPVIVECKGGFTWEDSWIKFKTAVTQFPEFTFYFAVWKGGAWIFTKFS